MCRKKILRGDMSAILNYLTGAGDPEALTQAVETLVERQTLPRLRAALTDHLGCDACQTYLVDYAQAQDLALPLTSQLQAVELHLSHCENCLADYRALQALSRHAEAEDLAEITAPAPNLAFLRATVPNELGSTLWQTVDETRRQLIAPLQIALSQATAWFVSWPRGLALQPVPVPVLRGSSETGAAQHLVLPTALGDLNFELTITPGNGLAQIVFGVFLAEAHQPIRQVTVTLLNQQRQRLHRADTNADGLVSFADLPPGSYYLQARTKDGHWEMRVVVNEANSSQ
jgi:hypothetical protein